MKFVSLKNSLAGSEGYFLFGITALLSLIALGCNILFLNSLLLGVIISPIYLFIVSFLCGSAFFPQESQRFRIFYGFLVFFCLLVVLGYIAYLIHDLSNLPILVILFVLTISLIFLSWKQRPTLSLAGIKLKERITGLNVGVLDFLFLTMVGLSFYFLFATRTGESIPPPWNLVRGQFFISLILATAVLLIKIWRGKSPSGLLLFYVILLVLIPALGLVILTHNPYDMKNALGLNDDWRVAEFGRFVSHSTQQEAATSIIHKAIIGKGQTMGDAFLIKLLQVSPLKFALFFIPILFTLMVVCASFDLMHCLAPGRKGLAPLCSLSFLATQHGIFQFTPPAKNEAFALGLLMVSVMLWVKFLQGQRFRWASFIAPVLLAAAISLIHQYVGLFALFLASSSLSLFLLKPFHGGLPRLLSWLGLSIGLIFVWIYGFPYLLSLADYLAGYSVGGGQIAIHQFTLSKFIKAIAPPLWSAEGLGAWQSIFYSFVNNSAYLTYTLIILGAIAAFRYKLNRSWLAISASLIVLAFGYHGIVGNFHVFQESYRYFSYFNLLAFPLMGVGLYWLASYAIELKAWLNVKSNGKDRFLSLKLLQLGLSILLLAALFTSSIWAGYPRPNSMGPYGYQGRAIWFPSDYDFAALNFIKAREGDEPYKDFFIVGDHSTSAAGVLTLGRQVLSPSKGYQSIFTFFIGRFGWEEFFNLAALEPIRYLVEGTEYTNRLVSRTYLIFTYRLGINKLKSVVNIYSEWLGKPIFSIVDKIYVFSYDKQQIASLLSEGAGKQFILFDDERAKDGFWKTYRSGAGNLDITINDNYDTKKSGNSSLEVITTGGKYDYIEVNHTWKGPVNLSEGKYLLLFAYGHNSGQKFNITFRAPTDVGWFSYEIKDNFEGWKHLVIPLEFFSLGNTPSWSAVTEMLIQFFANKSTPGNELYLDQISIVGKIPIRLLYEELEMTPP